jgi:hypothetical protein
MKTPKSLKETLMHLLVIIDSYTRPYFHISLFPYLLISHLFCSFPIPHSYFSAAAGFIFADCQLLIPTVAIAVTKHSIPALIKIHTPKGIR